MDKERVVEFECLRCEAKHKERYWDPNRTVHCKACGNVAYPVEGYLPKEKVQRKCRSCGALLRVTNHGSLCALCER